MRAIALLLLISCTQHVDFGPEPEPPASRLRPGLEPCSSATNCAAGSCFVAPSDGGRYCTGANDLSACDVITCDAPARCLCTLSNPAQCGCSF